MTDADVIAELDARGISHRRLGCHYAKRTDSNHSQVIEALTAAGWYCLDTSRAGFGAPDVIAVRAGVVRMVEIKDGGKSPSSAAAHTGRAGSTRGVRGGRRAGGGVDERR